MLLEDLAEKSRAKTSRIGSLELPKPRGMIGYRMIPDAEILNLFLPPIFLLKPVLFPSGAWMLDVDRQEDEHSTSNAQRPTSKVLSPFPTFDPGASLGLLKNLVIWKARNCRELSNQWT